MAKIKKVLRCGCQVAIKSNKEELLTDHISFIIFDENCYHNDDDNNSNELINQELDQFQIEVGECKTTHNLIIYLLRHHRLCIDGEH